MTERKPWAFIAHKGGYWAGVTTADEGASSFLAQFIKDGFGITTVYDRAEYKQVLDGMKPWHESPDYQRRNSHRLSAELPF